MHVIVFLSKALGRKQDRVCRLSNSASEWKSCPLLNPLQGRLPEMSHQRDPSRSAEGNLSKLQYARRDVDQVAVLRCSDTLAPWLFLQPGSAASAASVDVDVPGGLVSLSFVWLMHCDTFSCYLALVARRNSSWRAGASRNATKQSTCYRLAVGATFQSRAHRSSAYRRQVVDSPLLATQAGLI